MYHSTFNVGDYDHQRANDTLAAMNRAGYNVVWVFLSPGCMTTSGRWLSDEYVRNVGDFLEQSQTHDIFVILTTGDLPWVGYLDGIATI